MLNIGAGSGELTVYLVCGFNSKNGAEGHVEGIEKKYPQTEHPFFKVSSQWVPMYTGRPISPQSFHVTHATRKIALKSSLYAKKHLPC